MASRTRLHGTFVEPVDELIPLFALPSHQIVATFRPREHTEILARSAAARQRLERKINDLLSDPSLL